MAEADCCRVMSPVIGSRIDEVVDLLPTVRAITGG